jgi:thiol-disulfide isomerase/thioredoxin
MMKKTIMFLTALAVCLVALHGVRAAAEEPLITGDVLATIQLPAPQDPEAKKYLGLAEEGSFALSQIKSQVVMIEIFNMYCTNCQREAPRVNELYQLMNKNPKLKGKIKMIGIGVGNTPLEVEVFKETYKVAFPLFPDADYAIHKMCGEVRTPYFIGVKIKADGSLRAFYTKEGGFQDPAQFLKIIVALSGL